MASDGNVSAPMVCRYGTGWIIACHDGPYWWDGVNQPVTITFDTADVAVIVDCKASLNPQQDELSLPKHGKVSDFRRKETIMQLDWT
jgi:hypothetical protein